MSRKPPGTVLPERSDLRQHRPDALASVILFLGAAVAIFLLAGSLDPRLLEPGTVDVWFEADMARVFSNMTDRWSNHFRAKVHPLFALIVFPPVFVLDRLAGLEPYTAVRTVLGLLGGLWFASFFILLRLIGNRRMDAILFSTVAATSSTALFWFAVPETHSLGSLTIVMALLLVAVAAHRRVPYWLDISVSALTLGVTVTNWMAGLASTVVRRSITRTVVVSATAFVLVLGLWAVSRQLMPSTAFFLGNPPEIGHILSPEARGPAAVTGSLFLHTVVMPAIEVVDRPGAGRWPIMLTQPAAPGSAGPWSAVSVVLWVVLLGLGAVALVRLRQHRRLRLFLVLTIAGQLVLHLAFGNETFLYSPNFLPMLLVLATLGALTAMRPAVLLIAVALIVTNGVNNVGQRIRAGEVLREYESMWHNVRQARRSRPLSPWPDTTVSNIVVVSPGARPIDRGSYRPGGSFSPGTDQFNISFWITDVNGSVSVGRGPGEQMLEEPVVEDSEIVGINIVTRFYQARWRAVTPRQWSLTLDVAPGPERVSVAVRSVGPEISPIRSLRWAGGRLRVNDRWAVAPSSAPAAVYLVDERKTDWMTSTPTRRRIEVENGWAAARIELPGPGHYQFTIRDDNPDAPVDRPVGRITSAGHLREPSGIVPVTTARADSTAEAGDVAESSAPRESGG